MLSIGSPVATKLRAGASPPRVRPDENQLLQNVISPSPPRSPPLASRSPPRCPGVIGTRGGGGARILSSGTFFKENGSPVSPPSNVNHINLDHNTKPQSTTAITSSVSSQLDSAIAAARSAPSWAEITGDDQDDDDALSDSNEILLSEPGDVQEDMFQEDPEDMFVQGQFQQQFQQQRNVDVQEAEADDDQQGQAPHSEPPRPVYDLDDIWTPGPTLSSVVKANQLPNRPVPAPVRMAPSPLTQAMPQNLGLERQYERRAHLNGDQNRQAEVVVATREQEEFQEEFHELQQRKLQQELHEQKVVQHTVQQAILQAVQQQQPNQQFDFLDSDPLPKSEKIFRLEDLPLSAHRVSKGGVVDTFGSGILDEGQCSPGPEESSHAAQPDVGIDHEEEMVQVVQPIVIPVEIVQQTPEQTKQQKGGVSSPKGNGNCNDDECVPAISPTTPESPEPTESELRRMLEGFEDEENAASTPPLPWNELMEKHKVPRIRGFERVSEPKTSTFGGKLLKFNAKFQPLRMPPRMPAIQNHHTTTSATTATTAAAAPVSKVGIPKVGTTIHKVTAQVVPSATTSTTTASITSSSVPAAAQRGLTRTTSATGLPVWARLSMPRVRGASLTMKKAPSLNVASQPTLAHSASAKQISSSSSGGHGGQPKTATTTATIVIKKTASATPDDGVIVSGATLMQGGKQNTTQFVSRPRAATTSITMPSSSSSLTNGYSTSELRLNSVPLNSVPVPGPSVSIPSSVNLEQDQEEIGIFTKKQTSGGGGNSLARAAKFLRAHDMAVRVPRVSDLTDDESGLKPFRQFNRKNMIDSIIKNNQSSGSASSSSNVANGILDEEKSADKSGVFDTPASFVSSENITSTVKKDVSAALDFEPPPRRGAGGDGSPKEDDERRPSRSPAEPRKSVPIPTPQEIQDIEIDGVKTKTQETAKTKTQEVVSSSSQSQKTTAGNVLQSAPSSSSSSVSSSLTRPSFRRKICGSVAPPRVTGSTTSSSGTKKIVGASTPLASDLRRSLGQGRRTPMASPLVPSRSAFGRGGTSGTTATSSSSSSTSLSGVVAAQTPLQSQNHKVSTARTATTQEQHSSSAAVASGGAPPPKTGGGRSSVNIRPPRCATPQVRRNGAETPGVPSRDWGLARSMSARRKTLGSISNNNAKIAATNSSSGSRAASRSRSPHKIPGNNNNKSRFPSAGGRSVPSLAPFCRPAGETETPEDLDGETTDDCQDGFDQRNRSETSGSATNSASKIRKPQLHRADRRDRGVQRQRQHQRRGSFDEDVLSNDRDHRDHHEGTNSNITSSSKRWAFQRFGGGAATTSSSGVVGGKDPFVRKMCPGSQKILSRMERQRRDEIGSPDYFDPGAHETQHPALIDPRPRGAKIGTTSPPAARRQKKETNPRRNTLTVPSGKNNTIVSSPLSPNEQGGSSGNSGKIYSSSAQRDVHQRDGAVGSRAVGAQRRRTRTGTNHFRRQTLTQQIDEILEQKLAGRHRSEGGKGVEYESPSRTSRPLQSAHSVATFTSGGVGGPRTSNIMPVPTLLSAGGVQFGSTSQAPVHHFFRPASSSITNNSTLTSASTGGVSTGVEKSSFQPAQMRIARQNLTRGSLIQFRPAARSSVVGGTSSSVVVSSVAPPSVVAGPSVPGSTSASRAQSTDSRAGSLTPNTRLRQMPGLKPIHIPSLGGSSAMTSPQKQASNSCNVVEVSKGGSCSNVVSAVVSAKNGVISETQQFFRSSGSSRASVDMTAGTRRGGAPSPPLPQRPLVRKSGAGVGAGAVAPSRSSQSAASAHHSAGQHSSSLGVQSHQDPPQVQSHQPSTSSSLSRVSSGANLVQSSFVAGFPQQQFIGQKFQQSVVGARAPPAVNVLPPASDFRPVGENNIDPKSVQDLIARLQAESDIREAQIRDLQGHLEAYSPKRR